ncbi:hypothetical protein A2625_00345 [candidate division WOR-1 bacterium RIFCSPHIGHO2_01_FULL_53_15]|uniref:Membrane protein 6-pyruvoyl-tetrahydropterin synthase-related domain-containing protein n=1 Tax=candidate division WOR-1 bacterium RIFCSPHIGHO2_01_FULL_53_15 TaxID=1802564 RepID=A0A1F4Q0W5_UNCSA|nr:MAG: hypothetical protein A2625_00345 [candidate division WOR-1 bacterium RIFCSPHIGHO2_01_FULL_53_15]
MGNNSSPPSKKSFPLSLWERGVSLMSAGEGFADLVVLGLIAFFLLSYFEPQLLLLKTTINGGDTGSHYPAAFHLKDYLLPHGKIMGWDQGNYAGYPLFYHYFPLPFLLMAFLSFFVSLEVSFKLITVLGMFLLPVTIYAAFRFLRYAFPVPIFAAVFSLPFLFNQGNSMWGGNIPSTLAGEFCYSLGLAFVLLLLGSLYRGVKEQKFLVFNALLIFLTGLSHAYTLIFALIIGSFFLLSDWRRNWKYLLGAYALGFLLLAFWLLPVLGNTPYTTTFVFRWTINSLLEVFPLVLIPFMALGVVSALFERRDERTAYFVYLALACVFIYLAGPNIGVLDIRFVPFFQLLLAIFGAVGFAALLKNTRAAFLLPLIVFIVVAVWVNANTTYIRSWINWNYGGYEQKNTWPIFHGINEFLKNSNGGRVEWEHAPADEALGSIRSSETLPYFAKRQTLEGIHMLGAISAPFVFYIESETSYQPCNPLQDYFYSTFDLNAGKEHFKLFNVSHFVVRSPEVKEALKSQPEFKLEKKVGEYNIYRLTTNSGRYVEPLAIEPVLLTTNDWRDVSYQWFAHSDPQAVFVAFKKKADALDRKHFSQVVTDLSQIKKSGTATWRSRFPRVTSVVSDETIDIETSELGHPLLIKVSYHPNWRVSGADRVYLVSPSFMLIFPTAHKVHLSFEAGPLGLAGKLFTLLGIVLALASPRWSGIIKTAAEPAAISGRQWFFIGLSAASALLILFLAGSVRTQPPTLRQRNEAAFNQAEALVKANKFNEGAVQLRAFIQAYPASFWTPQAYFDLAYSENNLGNKQSAIAIYKKIIRDFPTTSWAKYSRDRLKELK